MAESDSELGAVIAAYLDAPGAPDPAALLATHPHLAPQLRAFLAADGTLEQLAAPLRGRDDPAPGAGVGAYTVLEKAGEGGMGVVYRARDERLGRDVALKLIHAGRHATPAERARFRVEAEAAARLSHPGIVRVFEVGEHDGLPFLAAEYCAGGTLADRLAGGAVAPTEAAGVVAALADAVQAAHDGQVLHRDLKPGNVLFDAGRPRITDFGLAKLLDGRADLTRTGVLLGSPPYMAPEQAAGRPDLVGPATDVYALGAVLFEALTGRPPFRGDTPLDTLRQVTDDPPPRPRGLNPAVPADLETVCLRCLEKEPARRFAAARDLAAELGRFLRGEPVRSRPVGPTGRAWRWCRRYPAVAALGGLVVAVSTAGGGVSAHFAAAAGERAESLAGALGKADAAAAAAGRARDEADDLRGKEAAARADAERRAGREAAARADAERESKRAGRELDRAEDLLHLLRVRAGHDGWLRGDPAAAAALDACRWDRRGWEHDFLATLLDGDTAALESALWAGALAVSPDGARVVGGEGGLTSGRVWDARTGRILFRLTGHAGRVEAVAFAPDGKSIVTGSQDGTVRRWDAATGAETARFDIATGDGAQVQAVAFAPGGGRAAFADRDGNVRVWDVATGRATALPRGPGDGDTALSFSADGARLAVLRRRADPLLEGPPVPTGRVVEVATGFDVFALPGGTAVAFSPDGKSLARVADGGSVHLHDAATGREARVLDAKATGVTFAPDGRRLAVGGRGGVVVLWDVASGRELARRVPAPGAHEVGGLAFDPDGRWLVAGACAKVGHDCVYPVVAWNTAGNAAAPRFAGPTGAGLVFASADGARVAAVGGEGDSDALAAWDTRTGRRTLHVPNPRAWLSPAAAACALAPSGALLVTGSKDGPVRAWDVAAGREAEPFAGHAGPVRWVAFAAGGARLATFAEHEPAAKGPQLDGAIRVWAVDGRRPLFRASGFDQPDPDAAPGRATSVTVSDDGTRIAAGFPTGLLRVWDVDTGKVAFEYREPNGRVPQVALAADGRAVAARLEGGRGNFVAVWNMPTGRRRHEFETAAGNFGDISRELRFSPDGARLTFAAVGVANVWDVTAGTVLFAGPGVEVSPDGRRVADGGGVWTAGADAPPPVRLQDAAGAGGAVRFLPDGRRLVQATDGGLAVWDAGSGHRMLLTREPLGSVVDTAVSADGSRVVCRTADGTVRVWAALKPAAGLLLDDPSDLGGVTAAGFLPGGREVVAVGGFGPSLRFWDVRTGRLRLQVPGATGLLTASGDGKRVAAEHPDRRLRVWDVETGRELAKTSPVTNVAAVALDGTGARLAVAPRTFDAGTHVVLVSVVGADGPPVELRGHERQVHAVGFSPDGSRVVTGSADHSVWVWDARTGKELFALKGFFPSVIAVGYSADGTRVLVRDRPDRTRAWDAATGEPLAGAAELPAGVSARSPDGRYRLDGTRLTDTTLAARRVGWDAEKLAAWATPDPDYHRREAAAALAAGNPFAHAFHAARVAAGK